MRKCDIDVILSIDYEIFGNGSGDLIKCLIQPTENILRIAENYNIPITIMFEIAEYWAFENEKERMSKPYQEIIDKQITNAIKKNHDVQLHLHPQWINYTYDKQNDHWILDLTKWRTSSLTYEELVGVFTKSKEYLEKWLRNYDSSYECNVFRAGGWSIQPEKDVLLALTESGFKIDSTVALDKYFYGDYSRYDFRDFPRKPFWYVKENLKTSENSGILELPILTNKIGLHKRIYEKIISRDKSRKINRRPTGCFGTFPNENNSKRLFDFIAPRIHMLDFTVYHWKELIEIIENSLKSIKKLSYYPIIAIGHPKTFSDMLNFKTFLIKSIENNYKFTTYSEVLKKIHCHHE